MPCWVTGQLMFVAPPTTLTRSVRDKLVFASTVKVPVKSPLPLVELRDIQDGAIMLHTQLLPGPTLKVPPAALAVNPVGLRLSA